MTNDAAGEPTRLSYSRAGVILFDEQISRNAVGLTTTVDGSGGMQTFTYDANGRVASASTTGHNVTYGYDAVGNRTRTTTDGATVTSTYDAADQIMTSGGTTFTHDERGNVTTASDASGTTTWTYDARNHLARVASGVETSALVQTDDGRVTRSVSGSATSALVEDILSTSNTLLGTTGAKDIRYLTDGTRTLASVGATTAASITDHLGSLRGDASATGMPSISTYDAWGVATSNAPVANTPGYTGGLTLPAQTTLLGQRAMLPALGAFAAPDPTNARGADDSQSLYTYAADQPLDLIDPTGQFGYKAFARHVRDLGVTAVGHAAKIVGHYAQEGGGVFKAAKRIRLVADLIGLGTDLYDVAGYTVSGLYACGEGIGDDIRLLRAGRATSSPSSTYLQDEYLSQIHGSQCDEYTGKQLVSDVKVFADVFGLFPTKQVLKTAAKVGLDVGRGIYDVYESFH